MNFSPQPIPVASKPLRCDVCDVNGRCILGINGRSKSIIRLISERTDLSHISDTSLVSTVLFGHMARFSCIDFLLRLSGISPASFCIERLEVLGRALQASNAHCFALNCTQPLLYRFIRSVVRYGSVVYQRTYQHSIDRHQRSL